MIFSVDDFFLPILTVNLSRISLPAGWKTTKFVLLIFRANLLLILAIFSLSKVPCLQSFVSVASLITQSKYWCHLQINKKKVNFLEILGKSFI